MYREICQTHLREFHSTVWEKSPMVSTIVHYDTSAMKRFLTSVSLQHESKASDVITLVKKTFVRTSIVRNFISRGVKIRISAREACVKPHLRTRSDKKVIFKDFFTHVIGFNRLYVYISIHNKYNLYTEKKIVWIKWFVSPFTSAAFVLKD